MKRFLPLLRRVLLLLAVCGIGLTGALALTNWWILRVSKGSIVERVKDLPAHDVGLVLGTSPKLRGGSKNPFFEARMNAAAALFRAGKVKHLLVSGDNGRKGYDEPSSMRDALVDRGVPAKAVTLDYAGFRTLDSVERARTVFGLKKAVIITDDFHLPRSLFLARAKGLKAVGFRPQPVPWKWSKKTRTREVVSRGKAWLDIYMLRTKPRFGGPREEIRLVRAR
jgi:SanA protein